MAADLMTVVTVDGPSTEGGPVEYLVNYSRDSVKSWLIKTTVWALSNNGSVTMRAATLDDTSSRREFKPWGKVT